MLISLSKLKEYIPEKVQDALLTRFRKGPVDSVESLADFVQTRAAYVTQTSLYGYIKNRMGIKYPEMFADETMAKSINIAKWRTYGSCIADLAIFSAASVGCGERLTHEEMTGLARHCYDYSVGESFDDDDALSLRDEIATTFEQRLQEADWNTAADGENAFLNSPVDLIRNAPIADELKAFDMDIVINSTRFRWRDIRSQLRSRLDAVAVAAEFRRQSGDTL